MTLFSCKIMHKWAGLSQNAVNTTLRLEVQRPPSKEQKSKRLLCIHLLLHWTGV